MRARIAEVPDGCRSVTFAERNIPQNIARGATPPAKDVETYSRWKNLKTTDFVNIVRRLCDERLDIDSVGIVGRSTGVERVECEQIRKRGIKNGRKNE